MAPAPAFLEYYKWNKCMQVSSFIRSSEMSSLQLPVRFLFFYFLFACFNKIPGNVVLQPRKLIFFCVLNSFPHGNDQRTN